MKEDRLGDQLAKRFKEDLQGLIGLGRELGTLNYRLLDFNSLDFIDKNTVMPDWGK